MADNSLAQCLSEIKANRGKFYVYVLSRPCGMPFYVGCGSGRRIVSHEAEAASSRRSLKLNIIRKLKRSGAEVNYRIDQWYETWHEAASHEVELIAKIGRRDLGLGPLANATAGGEGHSSLSPQARQKKSETSRKMWLNESSRAKLTVAFRIAQRDPQLSARKSDTGKRNWADPSYREKVLEARKAGGNLNTTTGLSAARAWRVANPTIASELNRKSLAGAHKWIKANPDRHREISLIGGQASSNWAKANPSRAATIRKMAGRAAGESHRIKAEIRKRCLSMMNISTINVIPPSPYAGWQAWQLFEDQLINGGQLVAVR